MPLDEMIAICRFYGNFTRERERVIIEWLERLGYEIAGKVEGNTHTGPATATIMIRRPVSHGTCL